MQDSEQLLLVLTPSHLGFERLQVARQGRARVENRLRQRRMWCELHAVAQAAKFSNHLARPHFLRFGADGRTAFLVPHALVENLPNQPGGRRIAGFGAKLEL
jgi:hypothetical protein